MFIKKLELFGFKTFAERTEIQMSSGITAVVGPNGCGKSNIADALLWVLGESNIRNLRGQRATDVIFSGSEKRKALGLAEVSLTLDNSCGTLPINYSEVTVTRRTYRSGEGEYFINKTRCRLKDIYELFLDTGIGREAYSTVTQGEIDAILSAKPEDRRELFEEAAGIKKYRYRRQEAMKRLERTQGNLNRVCDIMSELGDQLEPLAEQAEQAKRFVELQSRLREIEIDLLIRDLRKHSEALVEVQKAKEGAADKIAEYDRLLSDLEWEKDKQSTALQQLEEEVEAARRIQTGLGANVQRLESRAALLDERMRSSESAREQADDEISVLERKIEETRERLRAMESERAECDETERRAKAEVQKKTAELQVLDARFEETSRAVSDQKASYLELAKEQAAKRNALQNSRDRIAQLDAALSKYADEIEALEEQKRDATRRGAEAVEQVTALETDIAELAGAISRVAQEREKSEHDAVDLGRRHADAARELASLSSRLSTLREMAEAHEGFYEGVRSVMAARKSGKLGGTFSVVADVVSVPKGYETAIETALGGSVQDIISDSTDEAKQAIAFLKANRAGRATFLPLDGIRLSNSEVRGRMDRRSGALGIAADLISYDGKYAQAIRSLLGRTVIAESVDDAVALSRELTGWNKIVTLEGELIVPSGAITGGVGKNRGPGLLLRKQEIDSLTGETSRLKKQMEELAGKRETAEQRLTALRAEASASEKTLGERRIALADQCRRVDFVSAEVERLGRQMETVSVEKDEAGLLRDEESTALSRLQDELQAAGQQNTDLDGLVAGAEQDVEELSRQRDAVREELLRLNVELAACIERTSALKNGIAQTRAAFDELVAGLAARHSQADGLSIDTAAVLEERGTVEQEWERQRELFDAADARLKELTDKRTLEHERATGFDSQLREAGRTRNQLAQDTHDADVKEARLEVLVTQAADRLLEEYEVTLEQALDWSDEVEVERGTATEVARLRREIRDMGPVNTGAVQEYERIRERWDFLSEQRADLEAARDQVNAAIREIDTNTRGLFMDTFNSVAANFDLVFRRLFGGGKAEISLTDPNDLLETGIDVTVQPPGKKLQDMALLSGGERALTATALIFALLMAKPSPFVVMDEVDAPLDESNVERFADVLKEFAENSQFIVVTHNRATMEAAKSLYGVTMQEPGISKVISVKLATEEPVESTALDSANEPEAAPEEVPVG